MKKVLALLLALVMCLSLAACGGKEDDKTPSSSNTPPSSGQQTQQPSDTPDPGTSQPEQSDNSGSASMIADGWDLPAYPYGELVYTAKNDDGVAVTLYFNNTTIEECQEYCKSLANAGLMSVTDYEIYGGTGGEGRYIDYRLANSDTNAIYGIYYDYDNTEHTVNTSDGDVVYQLSIRKTQ